MQLKVREAKKPGKRQRKQAAAEVEAPAQLRRGIAA